MMFLTCFLKLPFNNTCFLNLAAGNSLQPSPLPGMHPCPPLPSAWRKRGMELMIIFCKIQNFQNFSAKKLRGILESPVQCFRLLLPLLQTACWIFCLLVHFFSFMKISAFEDLSEISQPSKVNNLQLFSVKRIQYHSC